MFFEISWRKTNTQTNIGKYPNPVTSVMRDVAITCRWQCIMIGYNNSTCQNQDGNPANKGLPGQRRETGDTGVCVCVCLSVCLLMLLTVWLLIRRCTLTAQLRGKRTWNVAGNHTREMSKCQTKSVTKPPLNAQHTRRHLQTCRWGSDGQCASTCQALWWSVKLLSIHRFLNMEAGRHLGFVVRMFGPQTKSIWWSLFFCRIWLKSMHVSLAWKCWCVSLFVFFGVLTP